MITAQELLGELNEALPKAKVDRILQRSFMDVEDNLKTIKTAANKMGLGDDVAKIIKDVKKLTKAVSDGAVKELTDFMNGFKFKEFQTFAGPMKVSLVRTSDNGYFVRMQNSDGEWLNVSHRNDGSWDSRIMDKRTADQLGVDLKKGADNSGTSGAYGPHGTEKFPDFEKVMKVLKKGR